MPFFKMIEDTMLNKELKKIISNITGIALWAIKNSSDLRDDLGIDSFTATEIMVAVEQKYKITITPTEVFNLETYNDVFRLIKSILMKR